MSTDKLVELQYQVRNNADDLQDFIRDLGSWQKEMEAKDNQLKMGKSPESDKLSSGENKDVVKSGKREGTSKLNESKPVPKKIKGHDYAAWDKFNVEEALGEDDVESEESEEDSEDEEQFLIQQAVIEKDKGNDFFKKGDYKSAIDCYTKGIQCDPSNPMLPANRAMALLKTGQTAAAEADCTLAISLDPTYVKAIHRRATARVSLKRFSEAISDFEKVLQLEPTNKTAKLELQKLMEQTTKNESAEQTTKPVSKVAEKLDPAQDFKQNLKASFLKTSNDSKKDVEHIFPVDKKPHQRSKKPMHRIAILDVDSKADDASQANIKYIDGGSDITPSTIVDIDGNKLSDKLLPPEEAPKKANLIDKIEIISSTDNTTEVKLPATDEDKKVSSGLQKRVEDEIMENISSKLSIADKNDVSVKFQKPPKSSVQFTSEWKQLKTPESRSRYVRLLQDPAKDYQKIFKHSMETNIFDDLVDLFSVANLFSDPAEVCRHLLGISRIPRISALVMFLNSTKQQQLQKLVDANVKQNSVLSENEKKEVDQRLQ